MVVVVVVVSGVNSLLDSVQSDSKLEMSEVEMPSRDATKASIKTLSVTSSQLVAVNERTTSMPTMSASVGVTVGYGIGVCVG
jgi:hypothetical protein